MHTVGAVLDGGMLHPGRSGRNHLRALGAGRRLSDAARRRAARARRRSTTPRDRRAGGYSLGMRQRLGLAAALLGDPQVLVLDEPANGLDPQGIRWLRDFLRTLAAEGRAVLVSSHVLAEVAQTADDVVVINKGRIVAQAPLAEIMARSGGGDAGRRPGRRAAGRHPLRAGRGRSPATARRSWCKDRTGEQIGRVVAEHQLVISELAPVGSSLEEIYFELTGIDGRPVMIRLLGAEIFKLRTHAHVLRRSSAGRWGWSLVIVILVTALANFEPDRPPARRTS